MKKISFTLIVIMLISISSVAFAQDNISYNSEDIKILKNILNETQNNTDILNWDIDNPNSIDEVEWTKINNEYYLSSVNFSNLSIDGDINLSKCIYLEDCDFSNTDINSIQLPCSLTNVTNRSFENCIKLQVVTINADNAIIGSNAFSGCISLKSIVNAEKIVSIGRNAFNNCENLDFYFSESNSNSFIENYAQQYNFNIVDSVISNTYGYAGIMNGYNKTKFDLNKLPLPYSCGTVSIYTMDKQFIKTINIDKNGKFNFENLIIGTKYRIVIDGDTAIPREEFFVPITHDYCITPNTECFGMIVCDYNRDGLVNSYDVQEFSKAYGHDPKDENFNMTIYDFNCDGHCNATDMTCFASLSYIDYHTFNYH
ncbi:MAG: leucine-rich repeat domain-containing protein [Eubacterium sp.]|nr:leucine-rich repeat domain-containing protein [Eubacterium sp.]